MTSKLARALGCIATIALAHVTPTADAEVVAGAGTSCGSYSVVHINGVFISQSLAEDNVRALRTKHGDWYENTPVSFGLVYNPKGGFPGDLAEVLRQRSVEYPGATFVQMIRYLLSFAPGDLPSKLVNELATYWANWINNNGGSYNTFTDAGLPHMVDKVRAIAGSNTRVLLVPHSQGNLYANRIVEIVTTQAAPGYAQPVPAQSIGIMGVASQSDKAEYRAWLFDLVGGDEVHLIEDRSVNPWRGSSTIWLSGVCRGWT